MSYLALYRKYRPNSFEDLVGQDEVSNIIKNEVLHNKLSHAYLFSGPRGTGKTSTAKIIAKMINCSNLTKDGIPCNECDSCKNFNSSSDIIEIDAASNNGVDEIREIRDKVNLVPTHGKYKIYIIDEVHMLTTQAFNALLKTLEEPPAHVIFILATTEFYKIPATVVSRCQKFQFLRFNNDDILKRLKFIKEKENILVDDDVLIEIARLSEGGMRDAINMLDQLSSFKESSEKIEIRDVYKLNGVVSYLEFKNIILYIKNGNNAKIIDFIEEINKNGKNLSRFINDLLSFLKDVLVFKTSNYYSENNFIKDKLDAIKTISDEFTNDELYKIILFINDLFNKINSSSFGKTILLVDFIKLSLDLNKSCDVLENNKSLMLIDNKKDEKLESEVVNNSYNVNNSFLSDKIKEIRINNTFSTANKKLKEDFLLKWKDVINKVMSDKNYFNLVSIINDINVEVVGKNNIIFSVKYDSVINRVYDNIDLLSNLLLNFYDNKYDLVFLTLSEWDKNKKSYVINLKNGVKYNYISENDENSVETFENKDDDIAKVTAILGEDIISYV